MDQQVIIGPKAAELGFTLDFPADWPIARRDAVTDAAHAADRQWRAQKEPG